MSRGGARGVDEAGDDVPAEIPNVLEEVLALFAPLLLLRDGLRLELLRCLLPAPLLLQLGEYITALSIYCGSGFWCDESVLLGGDPSPFT
eukprot:1195367-Prorocentrum_minimum.AAC.4